MKTLIYAALLSIFPALGIAATNTFNATAVIQIEITMAETTPLNFGTIIVSAGKGNSTVSIDANNTVTQTGTFTLTGTPKTGVYSITGSPNAAISLSVGSIVDLTLNTTKLKASINLNVASVTLNSTGTGSFKALGNIIVPDNTPPGSYTGSFNVTAVYN